MEEKVKDYLELGIVILLFVGLSYLVQINIALFDPIVAMGFLGMAIYVGLVILAIVIAPVSTVPLIPLASKMWGWEISAALNIMGWTIGAIIAFVIARRYGKNLVRRIIPIGSLEKIESQIPCDNVFRGIVFLRMAIPVDILSYALGLFTRMGLKSYALATLIGVIPFGIVLSYVGAISFYYQVSAILISGVILLFGFRHMKDRRLSRVNKALKKKGNPKKHSNKIRN